MIAVLKPTASRQQLEHICLWAHEQGLEVQICEGKFQTVLAFAGDTICVDAEQLEAFAGVEAVKRISAPFTGAGRKSHLADTVVQITPELSIGGGHFQIIAGPCSAESRDQIISIAQSVSKSGATLLRGGAFKPRTSPYVFQGLQKEGLKLLLEAKKLTGMPIVSEIVSAADIELFQQVDVIQVGARNMQNYDLLKHLGQLKKPVLLKRGLANTLKELLLSAEYIIAGGNENVILCERGIRTFEHATRNTLDLSAVPMLRELTHLPIVVDPSHATGMARLVPPMALAAAAAGADGIMIEVHNDPIHALCDGAQALTPEQFATLAKKIIKVRQAVLED